MEWTEITPEELEAMRVARLKNTTFDAIAREVAKGKIVKVEINGGNYRSMYNSIQISANRCKIRVKIMPDKDRKAFAVFLRPPD